MHMPAYGDGSVTIAGIAVAADIPPAACPRHPIYPTGSGATYKVGFATRISSVLAAFSPPVGLATTATGVGGGTG